MKSFTVYNHEEKSQFKFKIFLSLFLSLLNCWWSILPVPLKCEKKIGQAFYQAPIFQIPLETIKIQYLWVAKLNFPEHYIPFLFLQSFAIFF